VDIAAAAEKGIFVANVPTGISGNADSVAELGIYLMIGLSRGGLVDREALEEALAGGTIAGTGLDVFWEEPPDPRDPIFSHNVMATPLIGGSTDVSMQGIVKGVVENIRRIEAGQIPQNCAKP
jgi:phosphoglycerate dehydrogenase-like enzyme